MATRASTAIAAFLLASIAAAASAAEAPRAAAPPAALALSPPLTAALREEMQAVDRGVQRIVSSIARADWAAVAKSAEEIRASFILERRLTAAQREELERALPADFVDRDARFHETAARLASAAAARDADLATFYAYKLTEACVACHGRYAGARFPGFAPAAPAAHHGAGAARATGNAR
jgi:hypothetical protein